MPSDDHAQAGLATVHTVRTGVYQRPDTFIEVDADLNVADLIGHDLQAVRFGDDKWNLAGHSDWSAKTRLSQRVVRFGQVPEPYGDLVRLVTLLRLAPVETAEHLGLNRDDVAGVLKTRTPSNPGTALSVVKHFSGALRVMASAHLHRVEPGEWGRVVDVLNRRVDGEGNVAKNSANARGAVVVQLAQVAALVGWPDLFGSNPFDGRDVAAVLPKRDSATNAVGPNDNHFQVLALAHTVINELGPNIVEHVAWWAARDKELAFDPEIRKLHGKNPRRRQHSTAAEERLTVELRRLGNEYGALPATLNFGVPTVPVAALARWAGYAGSPTSAGNFVRKCAAAVSEQLVSEGVITSPLEPVLGATHWPPAEIATLPHVTTGDPVPFTDSLLPYDTGLHWWVAMLVRCVAYKASMACALRDDNGQANLAVGCITWEESDDGEVRVPWMATWETKGRTKAQKVPKPVDETVVRGVELVERLHELLRIEPVRLKKDIPGAALFPTSLLPETTTKRGQLYFEPGWFDLFANCAKRLHGRGVFWSDFADLEIGEFREVRVTSATAFASSGAYGSAVVGRMLGHTSGAMTSGYVGSSQDRFESVGFGAEGDKELENATARMTTAVLTHLAQNADTATGNGATKAEQVFANNEAFFTPEDMANPKPVNDKTAKQIQKDNPNVHWNEVSVCIYDESKALCKSAGGDETVNGPAFLYCRPGRCPNSVMTQGQVARVELRIRSAEKSGAQPRGLAHMTEDLGKERRAELKDVSNDELRERIGDEWQAVRAIAAAQFGEINDEESEGDNA